MCMGNSNYLLRGPNATYIADQLCKTLTDSEMAALFTLISAQINFTEAKELVFEGSSINNFEFIVEALKAAESAITIQTVICLIMKKNKINFSTRNTFFY